jgi:hypothetical protein
VINSVAVNLLVGDMEVIYEPSKIAPINRSCEFVGNDQRNVMGAVDRFPKGR